MLCDLGCVSELNFVWVLDGYISNANRRFDEWSHPKSRRKQRLKQLG